MKGTNRAQSGTKMYSVGYKPVKVLKCRKRQNAASRKNIRRSPSYTTFVDISTVAFRSVGKPLGLSYLRMCVRYRKTATNGFFAIAATGHDKTLRTATGLISTKTIFILCRQGLRYRKAVFLANKKTVF